MSEQVSNSPQAHYKWMLDGKHDASLAESTDRFETRNGLRVWYGTDKGARDHNEDRVGVVETGRELLLVDVDGMGGHARGEAAAECVCTGMMEHPDALERGIEQSVQNMVDKNLPHSSGACLAAGRIFQNEKEHFLLERTRIGDCVSFIITPDGRVTKQTTDQDLITQMNDRSAEDELPHLDEDIVLSQFPGYRGIVSNYLSRNGTRLPMEIEEPIELEPGSFVLFGSDGTFRCVSPREFVTQMLKPRHCDMDAALEELSRVTTERMANRENFRQEFDCQVDEDARRRAESPWFKNGKKCSDGFEHFPPWDNRSIIAVRVPEKKGNGETVNEQAATVSEAARNTTNGT